MRDHVRGFEMAVRAVPSRAGPRPAWTTDISPRCPRSRPAPERSSSAAASSATASPTTSSGWAGRTSSSSTRTAAEPRRLHGACVELHLSGRPLEGGHAAHARERSPVPRARGLHAVRGIEVARTEERMEELQRRRMASAKSWGVEPTSLVTPAEIEALVPYVDAVDPRRRLLHARRRCRRLWCAQER